MASTNPRFVSRPASHVPQVLTVATLAAAVGQKGVASATKAPPTSGHGPDVDFKKALSLQLQNALKLVISQNTASGGILTRQSPALNQDTKSSSSLRPQSAPATPVKGATTAAPSPASNTPTSIQSPLKSGTVAYKVAGTKVVPLSSKGSISVASTSQNTTTATTSLINSKDKDGPSQTESTSKTSKLSAIESLLCEETISPKNSPGSVKIEKASVAPTRIKPEEEKKDEESKTPEDHEKVEHTESNLPVAAPERNVEDSKTVVGSKTIEEREKVDNSESHPQKAASDAGKISEKPVEQEKNANLYIKCDALEVVEDDTHASNEKEQTNSEAAVKKSIDEQPCPLSTSTAEEKANLDGSTTDSTKSSDSASLPAKHAVKEGTVKLTNTSTSSSKADTAKTEIIRPSKVQIKVLKSTPSPQPQPNPPTIASDKEEMVGVNRDEVSSKESEMMPPQVKDTLATPSQTMTTSVTPHQGKTPVSAVVVTLARKRSPSPSCEALPPAKKPALTSKEGPAKTPTTLSQSSTLPSISTPTVAQTSSITSTITTATTAAVKVDMESPMDISTPSVDAEPSAQLQSEVSADSLIQSLCSDSTSFEEDPDVSVLASQLGLDSVDSPIFNLSGFLSLIQPDLSVLQPGVPESSSGGEQTLGKAPGSSVNIVEKIHPDEKKRGLGESTNRDQPQSVSSVLPPVPDSLASPLEAGATTLGLETDPTKFVSTSPHQQPLTQSSDSSTPALTQRVSEAATPALLSPVLLPEDPIPPPTRPLVLTISDVPSLPSLGGAPTTPPPLTPTPLTPLGEGLLDISDIRSLVDESETMEGISQDVFESIEKLVNLDEQSTNATWK